jgi:hypothetical protein
MELKQEFVLTAQGDRIRQFLKAPISKHALVLARAAEARPRFFTISEVISANRAMLRFSSSSGTSTRVPD